MTQPREDCYGAMFPDALHSGEGREVTGRVFSYELETAGGLFRRDRHVRVDLEAWEECTECQQLENCYRLSMARIALEGAIRDR